MGFWDCLPYCCFGLTCCSWQQFRKGFIIVLHLVTVLVSGTFAGLAIATFVEIISHVYNETDNNREVRAPLAALVLGAAMVILFIFISIIAMLRNFLIGDATFWYGTMMSTCFQTMILQMLVGITLQAFDDEADKHWKQLDSNSWDNQSAQVFKVTYVFAYITVGLFFAFFITLVLSLDLVKRRIQRISGKKQEDEEEDEGGKQMGAWQPAAWNSKPAKEEQSPNYNSQGARVFGEPAYEKPAKKVDDEPFSSPYGDTGAYGASQGGAYGGQGAYGAYKV